jgi:hypothetical protein
MWRLQDLKFRYLEPYSSRHTTNDAVCTLYYQYLTLDRHHADYVYLNSRIWVEMQTMSQSDVRWCMRPSFPFFTHPPRPWHRFCIMFSSSLAKTVMSYPGRLWRVLSRASVRILKDAQWPKVEPEAMGLASKSCMQIRTGMGSGWSKILCFVILNRRAGSIVSMLWYPNSQQNGPLQLATNSQAAYVCMYICMYVCTAYSSFFFCLHCSYCKYLQYF